MKKNGKVVAIVFVIDRFEETKKKWEHLFNAGLIPVDIYNDVSYGYPDEEGNPRIFELNNPTKEKEVYLTKFLARETTILGKGGIFEEETEEE